MRLAGFCAVVMLGVLGCTSPERRAEKSPLAARLERDGAGDLTIGVNGQGAPIHVISEFLTRKGLSYSAEIRTECDRIVAAGTPVRWHDSLDYRICVTANLTQHGGKRGK